MENEKEPEIREVSVIVKANCENCKFVRYNVKITGNKFSNHAGSCTYEHLKKHPDHIMKLSIGKGNKKYTIKNNQFEVIK